jgi:3-deoxy-D-arabino-heptulosonate 7-phosphate (DAHP) synthase
MIKRGFGMTADEAIGIYDLCEKKFGKQIYLIDRGIVTFDRHPVSRWSPDLKGVLWIKNERPDIFSRLVIDCSHSVFDKRMVGDVYRAFRAVGVEHFMFECTIDGKSLTDQAHMLSVAELADILE